MIADVALKGLRITQKALHKIDYFARLAPGEVSGLGFIEEEEEGFLVKDIFLFNQTNGLASTEMHPRDIANFVGDLIRADREDLISKFKFWWHSHGNIGVMWSITDEETIDTLSDEYSFSLVTNKKKEYLVRCDVYKPFRITLNNVPLLVEEPEDVELLKKCQKELDEKTNGNFKLFKRKKKGVKISTSDLDLETLDSLLESGAEGGKSGRKLIYSPTGSDQTGEDSKYSGYGHRSGRSRVLHRTSSGKDGSK